MKRNSDFYRYCQASLMQSSSMRTDQWPGREQLGAGAQAAG